MLALGPNPIAALNRAVALAEVEGPEVGLSIVDGLTLDSYHFFHAIRADFLRRLNRNADGVLPYDAALARTENTTERNFLLRRSRTLRV